METRFTNDEATCRLFSARSGVMISHKIKICLGSSTKVHTYTDSDDVKFKGELKGKLHMTRHEKARGTHNDTTSMDSGDIQEN